MIEILTSSALNTIQDFGRPHAIGLGVSPGGAMDTHAFACGNILLGNARSAAALEIVFFPVRVRFLERTGFALTGASGDATLDGVPLPPDWAMTAGEGQILTIGRPSRGTHSYLCLSGGIDVPEILGARATDRKAAFGGLDGRAPQTGDRLKTGPSAARLPEQGYGLATPCPMPTPGTTIRAIPAAEYPLFTPVSLQRFTAEPWTLTPNASRTGFRLEGHHALDTTEPLDLLSHGIVPGTVQIPPIGQPIVQMAEANTCGGYPKIATIIEQDLRLLAQTRIGAEVRFSLIDRQAAIADLRAQARARDALEVSIAHLRTTLSP